MRADQVIAQVLHEYAHRALRPGAVRRQTFAFDDVITPA